MSHIVIIDAKMLPRHSISRETLTQIERIVSEAQKEVDALLPNQN